MPTFTEQSQHVRPNLWSFKIEKMDVLLASIPLIAIFQV